MGKVISFIKFIKEEEEPTLDVLNILEENEWYSSEEMKKSIEDKRDD
jgi:hypothetical protein